MPNDHKATAESDEICGSFGCTLPKGHNRGRVDVPSNHAATRPKSITVTLDDLYQWAEDAITQGIRTDRYVYNVLAAALSEAPEPPSDNGTPPGTSSGGAS